MSRTLDQRLRLGGAAVLTVNEAIRMLPLRDDDARAWLEENDLIDSLRGRRVVVWKKVVDCIAGGEVASRPPVRRVQLRRDTY